MAATAADVPHHSVAEFVMQLGVQWWIYRPYSFIYINTHIWLIVDEREKCIYLSFDFEQTLCENV